MRPPFAIAVDPNSALLRVVVRDFWLPETVTGFLAALRPAIAGLRERHDRYDIVVDAREFPVQSGSVGEGFLQLMQAGAARTRGRTAVIVGSALAAMQAKRVLNSPNIAIFRDPGTAAAWLGGTTGTPTPAAG